MKTVFHADRLDLAAFARDGARIEGENALARYPRLMAETRGMGGDEQVAWAAGGELRPVRGGKDDVWLHVEARVGLPLVCQRCLEPVTAEITVDRQFRFVADEETALAEDDEAEEDLLVFARQFDLHALVEDELLMEIPAVPRHETCPSEPRLEAVDEAFVEEAAKPNPFAVLQKLRGDKKG
ncbi:MAG: YceD family protein [Burkholderiaceae bacterium]